MSYTNGLDDPTLYFNTVLYTGDGTNGRAITGVGFQPDLVWFKKRSTTGSHNFTDSVRGNTKILLSNQTLAELTESNTMQSFDSDGFTVDSGWNSSSTTIVTWNWLASNTTASNTDGSITSTVSASTTSGFSIVSYTGNGTSGATVGHSLGSIPSLMIVKRRSNIENWRIYHKTLGATKNLDFNADAPDTATTRWNDTEPTSSVFSIGNHSSVNFSGDDYVAYLFTEKKGFSKFGSYTGNGNADGTFVYTGFKPAFFMVKRTNTTGSWFIYDNKRPAINVTNKVLFADVSDSESTTGSGVVDILSNGWKWRGTGTGVNGSGDSYIYMAFAESPFTTSTGIPTTAR